MGDGVRVVVSDGFLGGVVEERMTRSLQVLMGIGDEDDDGIGVDDKVV